MFANNLSDFVVYWKLNIAIVNHKYALLVVLFILIIFVLFFIKNGEKLFQVIYIVPIGLSDFMANHTFQPNHTLLQYFQCEVSSNSKIENKIIVYDSIISQFPYRLDTSLWKDCISTADVKHLTFVGNSWLQRNLFESPRMWSFLPLLYNCRLSKLEKTTTVPMAQKTRLPNYWDQITILSAELYLLFLPKQSQCH